MRLQKRLCGVWIGLSLCVANTAAQTVNNIPKYNSGGTLNGSAIYEVNGNVGVGTQTPAYPLDIGLGTTTWSSWKSFSAPAIASNIYSGPGIQKVNARASLYAAIAARNPGTSFSLYVIPWDGVNTLEENCNSQANSYWNAQAAVKGNYFYQTFDNTDFSQYSTVLTNQSDFDNNKSSGTQWWIGCSTLPSYSVGNVLVPSSSNIFDIGGGSNPGVGLDVQGYGAYVGNGIYATIVGSNTTAGCDGCGYYGGYFTSIGNSAGYTSNNIGLYASATGSSANNFAAIFDQGNVGVGSTNPVNAKLQVSSPGIEGSVPVLGATDSGVALDLTNYIQNTGLLAGVLSNGNAYLQAQRTDGTAKAYNILINPNGGNVGIGTASPEAKLEVNGNIKFTAGSGGGITFPDGSVQSSAYNGVAPTNAATAYALAATPTDCVLPQVAVGISANGNAICATPTPPSSTNGWNKGGTSLSGGYWVQDPEGHIHQWGVMQLTSSTSDVTISFPTQFTQSTTVSVTISAQNPSGSPGYLTLVTNDTNVSSFMVHQDYQISQIINWQADGY